MPASIHRLPLLCLSLAAPFAGVHAQEDPLNLPLQLAQTEPKREFVINDGMQMLHMAFDEMGPERVVKGAPYCAEAVHETVQWLPDANGTVTNRIVHQQSTRLCRDGEGRTRQEVDRGGRKLVYLRDPVTRDGWVIDPDRKTARRIGEMRGPGAEPENTAWREYGERMREWAREFGERARGVAERTRGGAQGAVVTPPTPATPPAPPEPVVIQRPEGGGPHGTEMRVLRLQRDGDLPSPADWTMPPPAVQWRAQAMAPRGAGSVSPLGGKEIEGLRANGERTSWVIEVGKVGNEKPIQITREVWTAPDLMVTLLSRDIDPRSGEINYRLKNVKRGEPDAALMRVPADYSKGGRATPRGGGPASGSTG